MKSFIRSIVAGFRRPLVQVYVLFFLIIGFLCVQIARAAIVSSNMVTYATITTGATNTSAPVLIGTAYIATTPSFVISDGGCVTGTNGFLANIKYGLGTNPANATIVATYTKARTNSDDGVVTPAGITLNIYAFAELVGVTNITAGAKAIFTQ